MGGRAAARSCAATGDGRGGRGCSPTAWRPAASHRRGSAGAAGVDAASAGLLAVAMACCLGCCRRWRWPPPQSRPARGAAGLARAGAGDLLRQRHRRRRGQDHGGARSRRAAGGARQGRAFPAARLWRFGARAAPRCGRRHGGTGRRRGAAAGRGRPDLDRRRPRLPAPAPRWLPARGCW